jgi:DnaK suppressor protein
MNQPVLTTDQLNRFRSIIEHRIIDLEHGVRRRDGIAIERTPDAVDEVQRAAERALAISHIDRESKQLQNARAALRRIQEGSFGLCEDCDEPISNKRLSAIPWATHCVACQEGLDRRRSESNADYFAQQYAA